MLCNSPIQERSPDVAIDDVNEDAVEETQLPRENRKFESGSISKQVSQVSSTSATKEVASSSRGPLVQATISTLFKKVEEKVSFSFKLWHGKSVGKC